MNLTSQILHQLADPTLTPNERARLRCQYSKQLEEVGNYEAAREAMGELWQGVCYRPVLGDLERGAAAEVLLRAGVLTGWIGSVKQIEGAQEAAKDLISESITLFETLGDIAKLAEAQMELGHCYWREGAYDNARVWLKEALSRLPDEACEAKAITLSRLATVEKVSNRLHEALQLHKQAAPLYEACGNHTIRGRFHNSFANLLVILGEAERRNDYIDQALIEYAAASFHFEQAGHTRYHACVENNLGFLFSSIKRFSEAHDHLDWAQALFTQLRDKVHIAQVDETRARVLLAEGRASEAEKLARCAVQMLETGGQQSLLAEALTTHGIILSRMSSHQHAQTILERGVEVAQNAGDLDAAGRVALTIIEELGEHLTVDELSATYERALDLLGASRNPVDKDRLLSCARRVLFLVGCRSVPPAWENFSLKKTLLQYEGRIIERALKDAGGVVSRAARLLGYEHHNTLVVKINKWHRHLLNIRSPIIPRHHSLMFVDESVKESHPVTILHVEDNKFVAKAMKDTLEMEGWAIETYEEGTAALEAISGETYYDVMIFDNEVPGMNGIELIRQTRQLPHRQQTPIIMFSASDVEREAKRAGANAFLKKPDDVTKITETVARLLARKTKLGGKGCCE